MSSKTKTSDPPKAFISYSWTSDEHEEWVINLATLLRESGVDVILDKWDLKEGHDAHHFMEQMVSNSEIRKVIIVADRKYVEKADHRAGGVGTETQIISPEIYSKQEQDKFVVVVAERDENGNPFLPVYYRSRIYIDLSDNNLYAKNFEQLLRWIFDRPLYVKPSIGQRPGFLDETEKPSLGTTALFQRALDAVRNNRSHRGGAVGEYFERLATSFESLRIPATTDVEFDDLVIASIDQFLPYRNESIEIFLALGQHGPQPADMRSVHRFFEQIYPYMQRPTNVQSYREWDFDNYKFIVHELFLYAVAALLKYERFEPAAALATQPYYVSSSEDSEGGAVLFPAFRQYLRSLEHRNKRLTLRRLSLRSDLLKSRAAISGLSFRHLMQADFILYVRDCLDSLREPDRRQRWWPETLLYAEDGRSPFEIFARAQSKEYFDTMKCLLGVTSKEELETFFQALNDQRLRLPVWEYQSFTPATLMGWSHLAMRV
jgi:hypothetical protein